MSVTKSVCARSFESTSSLQTGWNIDAGSRSSVPHTNPRSNAKKGVDRNARTRGAVAVAVDVEHAYGTLVAHALLCNIHDLLVVGEGDALDRRRGTPTRRGSCPSARTRAASNYPRIRKRGSAFVLHARRRPVGEDQSCGGGRAR
jgi:hypothetical protein